MISLITSDQLPQNAIDFVKHEWKVADVTHFGKEIQWKKNHQAIIAQDDEKIVGVLELTIQAGVMYIDELIVEGTKHGQGIGKTLMEKAEEIAQENKLHKIYLDTGENWSAVKFYEKLGYKKTAVLPKHYVGIDYFIFTKFL